MRVIATFADGQTRDVTREAYIESGNTDDRHGPTQSALLSAIRRGEAPVLARYEGAYAATTLTVMGDRTGFVWAGTRAAATTRSTRLVAAKWQRMKIKPSGVCTDAEFIRRDLDFDLPGLPPSPGRSAARSWRQTRPDSKAKRGRSIEARSAVDGLRRPLDQQVGRPRSR